MGTSGDKQPIETEPEPMSVSPAYIPIMPLMTVTTEMITSADSTLEIDAGELLDVTVRWRRLFNATSEPIAVWATNGAEILVSDSSDVVFNGVAGAISNIRRGDGVVRFTTGAPLQTPNLNEISFRIQAPRSTENFEISVKIGLESTPNGIQNFVARSFDVTSMLYIEVSHDEVVGSTPFEIFGRTNFTDT